MSRTRIFVLYDPDHDSDLDELLRAQSRRPGSSFEVMARTGRDRSGRGFGVGDRLKIKSADEVIVICGEHTHESAVVADELSMVQEEKTPYMLLWGRPGVMCTKPDGSRNTDAMYSWTREILESQIQATLRNARPIVVPANCRRLPH